MRLRSVVQPVDFLPEIAREGCSSTLRIAVQVGRELTKLFQRAIETSILCSILFFERKALF